MEGQSEHAGDGGGSRVVLHVGDNTEEQGTAAVLGKLPLKIAALLTLESATATATTSSRALFFPPASASDDLHALVRSYRHPFNLLGSVCFDLIRTLGPSTATTFALGRLFSKPSLHTSTRVFNPGSALPFGLDLERGQELSSGLQLKPLKQPDPVDLGLLSQWEAMALVEHFHSHLNPYIILLDKHLHTYEYVKSSSTVLFSAMLAASAKFFRSDLYSSLLLFAQQIVTRFMGGDGPQHVGLCQAILIQAYWKEPFDSSAWLKIGYAIRLGYQLGLHRNRKTPLPPDELEARVVVDAERTWVTLCCFDHSSCMTVDDDNEHEYSMITRHNIDIDSWLTETRHFDVSDDNEQGASIELIRVYSLCKNIANGTSKTAASTLASHVSSMLRAMQRKFLDADSPSFRLLSPQAAHKVRWHWRAASVALAKACIIAAGVDDQVVLADFLAKTAELVECFEELATEGLLRFFQDLTAVVLLGLGEFCGKLFSQVDQDVQTVLVGFLTRIYTAARRAKDGDENSVAGFISRFFKAVLTALRGETTPSSPGSGGGQADQLTGPFEQLEGLDLFNTDLDALVAELAHDNESSISSAQANSSWAWLDAALLQPQDPPPPLSS
ncbi:hypothetical protein JCM8547_009107 [Rhodosporidiobolus lusitaniae]